MNLVSKAVLSRMPKDKIRELSPLGLTYEGELIAYIVKPDDVIVIGDLHPRVKAQFRAKEALIRRGMPQMKPWTMNALVDVPIVEVAEQLES